MRVVARSRASTSPPRWLRWLEPLSTWTAAAWGFALGLDTMVVAIVVFERTHAVAAAAGAAVGTLAASLAALLVALDAVERLPRRSRGGS